MPDDRRRRGPGDATLRSRGLFFPIRAFNTARVVGQITWLTENISPTDGNIYMSAWAPNVSDSTASYKLLAHHVFGDIRTGPVDYALTLIVPWEGSLEVDVVAEYHGETN